jgi:hypothetical protein
MVQNQKIVLIGPSGQMCHSLEVEQYPLHMAHNGTTLEIYNFLKILSPFTKKDSMLKSCHLSFAGTMLAK